MVRTIEIKVGRSVIEANLKLAKQLRELLNAYSVKAYEFLGSPGSGKTSLIERLISMALGEGYSGVSIGYIGGDVATRLDAERIARHGVQNVQINTGGICHLEVPHIYQAIESLDLEKLELLFIENVGNLICPADFPLGAHRRVLVVSVTEGEDKFLKHPITTRLADVIVINKVDLADAVEVDVDRMERDARGLNPRAPIVRTSARTGEGVDKLYRALMGDEG